MQMYKNVWLPSLLMVLMLPLSSNAVAKKEMARMPFSLAVGKSTFNKHCVACHGNEGVGTEQGPPLMHKYYEPSHHNDFSFYRAMTTGVKQHHWSFGDMPPVLGLDQKKMIKVIEYLRWLQRQVGID